MKIILISGKARSGKDSFAEELKKVLIKENKRVLLIHYADLLKFICTKFFNWNGTKDERGRDMLQKIGTDVIRNHNPEYLINFIKNIVDLFPDEWDYVLIPDCRFKNEITSWKFDGFDVTTVRIERVNLASNLTEGQQKHSSETDLDYYNFDRRFVINEGYSNVIKYAKEFANTIL